MMLRPPRSTRTDTLLPDTTRFRSAADVLRQVARAAAQHVGHRQHARDQRVVDFEAGLAQALFHRRLAVALAVALGEQCDLVRRQSEGLGPFAHRAPAARADHPGGTCGAGAALVVVEVLLREERTFQIQFTLRNSY